MKRRFLGLLLATILAIVALIFLLGRKGPLPSRDEINETLNELAISLHQGQPLQEAIKQAVNRSTNPQLKRAWKDVLRLVSQGRSLSRAMSARRDIFPEDLINTVLQGELKGNVDAALMQYISQHEPMR